MYRVYLSKIARSKKRNWQFKILNELYFLTARLAATAGYAWEQAEQANMHNENIPHHRERESRSPTANTRSSMELLEIEKEKAKPSPKKIKTGSDSAKSPQHHQHHHNTAWEKTKEAFGSVASCVKHGKHGADGGGDYGDRDDGVGGGKLSIIPENVGTTKTWNDIKTRADDILEESKEYPGVHLDTNKVCDSGCECSVCSSGKEKHTLFDTWDCESLDRSKHVRGVDSIPESVKRVENEFENAPDNSENTMQQENNPDISLTEQKMESVKRDLDKILHSVDEKCKVSIKDVDGGSVMKARKVVIKAERIEDRDATQHLKGITTSVKEVQEKCKSAVEKLPESLA